MDNRTVLLTDEDDAGYGYLVSQSPAHPEIYVSFWGRGTETKNVLYSHAEDLYEKSRTYTASDLIDLSPMHRAKFRVSEAFIRYYETIYRK